MLSEVIKKQKDSRNSKFTPNFQGLEDLAMEGTKCSTNVLKQMFKVC